MATQQDQWAEEMIQSNRRRPIMIGVGALVGIVLMIILVLYSLSQFTAA